VIRIGLQRQAFRGGPQFAPAVVHDVLGSAGRPLEPGMRGDMEARFGHSFSQVRVHTGEPAAASAQSVGAAAYTVGRHVVFGAGRYAPGTAEGRSLLAHELAHVVQQGTSGNKPPGSLPVAPASGELESQAESAAGAITAGTASPAVQRKVVVNPPAAASQIESHLRTFCGATLTHSPSGQLSQTGCSVLKPDEGNDCVCDVVDDAKRLYTINVAKSVVTMKPQKLWDGTTVPVPDASLFPKTSSPAVNPVLRFPDTGSDIELGSFDAAGKPKSAPLWRVLGHELCGHGRLKQTYSGDTGDRAGHDSTIDTENAIASALGEPLRGHYADPRQGESFFNKKGDPKLVFTLKDGLHYEVP
jgi:Domain of unknown function (DUF4157)